MSNVTEYVSGSPETTELRKTSNSTANAFVTVTYSYEMECEVLRSFFHPRARRCHFCMGISQKYTEYRNGLNPAAGFWRFFFI